jgi:hypothetical protein
MARTTGDRAVPDDNRHEPRKIDLQGRVATVTLHRRGAACAFVEVHPPKLSGR